VTLLFAGSGAILLLLGLAHLYITLATDRLHPRDADLKSRMQEVSPVLTRQTTMWKTWVGFNISHSLGAILFGLVYGYLALFRSSVLVGSPFLLGLGAATLLVFLVLGKVYWFRTPFLGIALASLLYLAGLVALAAG